MLGKIREWLRILVVLALLWPVLVQCTGNIRHYKFNVMMRNITRVCSTKPTVTVNGKFPGPTIYAREDDTLLIKVVNQVHYNLTVHWHGVKQIRTCWSDGPAYIAQCPIQPGKSYVYNFTVTDQRGTLFWHAHILWLRATVHGAIVILPTLDLPYPFSKPQKEVVIILGEWWKSDVEAVIDEATQSGLPPNISDAHTINGLPGPVSTCLSQERFNFLVEPGKKYLLRIINTALNEELFFKIAGHNLTVVEVDAAYVKPFETETILTAPGQTTNVILSANHKSGKYLMVTSPYMDSPLILVNNKTATATLQYISTNVSSTTFTVPPHRNATSIARKFMDSLRSLNSKKYPAKVPMKIDHSLFFIISLGLNPCASCYKGFRIVAAINNVTFVMPSVSLLNAHFNNRSGAFTDDFPGFPQYAFDYTGIPPENLRTMEGTKLYRLEYNSSVQLILQDTGLLSPENHPMHLHGFNFFVVGRGKGNFNPKVDPKNFNLVDPVERNTINAPSGGWVAIRFRANNPGVWFLHCHLEVHTTWGLKMAFVVDNGNGPNESLLPPPNDLPKC